MRHTGTGVTVTAGFDPRNNSLNFMRLAFACVVLVVHVWGFGGYGTFGIGHYSIGELSVDGFFALSGFLITRSRVRTATTVRYLWHRFLRIMPGFWVCLIVTALFFGAAGWWHQHGSLAGYVGSVHGPVQYVVQNSVVKMSFYDIGGTPALPGSLAGIPAGPAWDASLWTLYWEIVCYVGVVVMAWLGMLHRRRGLVLVAFGVVWAAAIVHLAAPGVSALAGQHAFGLMRFVQLFLAGAVVYLYGDRIPLSNALAAVAAAISLGACYLTQPTALLCLPYAYLCIWAATRLPFGKVGSRRDLSYGLYIYAFPVQQLLRVYDIPRFGVVAFLAATAAGTLVLAFLSWTLIEKPAMSLKGWQPSRGGRRRTRVRTPASDIAPDVFADAVRRPVGTHRPASADLERETL